MTAPKRILYVENGVGYGGAIICLRHLVRNLDRGEYQPMVVTGFGGALYRDIASEARWRHIRDRRVDTVDLKRRLDRSRWPDAVPGMRWIANQLVSRLDDVANFLPFFLSFLWTAIRFRPCIIHVNNEPLCNRAAVVAGKLLGIPVVAHVRGDQQGSRSMAWLFRLPDHFIPVSRWISESIGRLGVPPDKRTYIYDGIELQNLDLHADGSGFRRQHRIPEDAFVVGLVGLLMPWKGQRLFVDAARRLISHMPEAVFALVGGTPEECTAYEQELRELALHPDLKGRLFFTGHVKDMPAAYNGLDVVVSASVSPEPLGTMIIESMAMARPLVAPAHGGALEMVENGATGLLFEPGNAVSLADAILALYRDPNLRSRLGTAARAHALKTFSVEDHVRQVEQVYRAILSTH